MKKYLLVFAMFCLMVGAIANAELISQDLGESAYTASGIMDWPADPTLVYPFKAFDGYLDTSHGYWNSGGLEPQWIEVDLGAVYEISQVDLYTEAGSVTWSWTGIYVSDSPIQGDIFDSSVTRAAIISGNRAAEDYCTSTFEAVTGRYVNIYTDANWALYDSNTPTVIALREVQVFGAEVPEPATMSLFGLAGVIAILRRKK